ncbi:hypothetical protein [Thioalkalivibrio thiocyanoxidans]|uniref:hypothetical protein n=1 Tax=Thioalkalivibrio thiocyanoxidans TaxID=152475 RepID=UPI000368DCB2|nr:hypothetical protein [Thioalkalivibrio thiocyanoxidans]
MLDGLRQAHQALDLTQRSPDIDDFTDTPGHGIPVESAADASYIHELIEYDLAAAARMDPRALRLGSLA